MNLLTLDRFFFVTQQQLSWNSPNTQQLVPWNCDNCVHTCRRSWSFTSNGVIGVFRRERWGCSIVKLKLLITGHWLLERVEQRKSPPSTSSLSLEKPGACLQSSRHISSLCQVPFCYQSCSNCSCQPGSGILKLQKTLDDCLLVQNRKLSPALRRGAQHTHVRTRGLTEGGDVFSVIAMAMVTFLLSLFSRLGESVGSLLGGKSQRKGWWKSRSRPLWHWGTPAWGTPPSTILALHNPEANAVWGQVPFAPAVYHWAGHLGSCSPNICPKQADILFVGGCGRQYKQFAKPAFHLEGPAFI